MINFSLQTGTDASAVSLMSSTDASTTPEMSLITGIYTFESEDNFQKYLKKLGVPYVLRSLASMATPVITISKNCQVRGTFCYSSEWRSGKINWLCTCTWCLNIFWHCSLIIRRLTFSPFWWCRIFPLIGTMTTVAVIGQCEPTHFSRVTHSSKKMMPF